MKAFIFMLKARQERIAFDIDVSERKGNETFASFVTDF